MKYCGETKASISVELTGGTGPIAGLKCLAGGWAWQKIPGPPDNVCGWPGLYVPTLSSLYTN